MLLYMREHVVKETNNIQVLQKSSDRYWTKEGISL